MKNISVKALAVGCVSALMLSVVFAVFAGYWVVDLYNKAASGLGNSNLSLVSFGLVTLVVCVAIPSYLAAFVARRNFILHSMLVGIFVSLLSLADWSAVNRFPSLAALEIISALIVAFLSGSLRKRQVVVNAQ